MQSSLGPTRIWRTSAHGESREQKNQKIRDMLLPAIKNDIIYYGEGLKELIFPLNAKHPGPQEREFAAEIRRVIVEDCV